MKLTIGFQQGLPPPVITEVQNCGHHILKNH